MSLVTYTAHYCDNDNDGDDYYIIIETTSVINAQLIAKYVFQQHVLDVSRHTPKITALFTSWRKEHGYYNTNFRDSSYLFSLAAEYIEINLRKIKLEMFGMCE